MNKQEDRRIFLKKSLVAGAIATSGTMLLNANEPSSSGVVSGKAKKKEVLYKKNKEWEKYYKTVF